MATNRSKAVLHELADLYSRFAFGIDKVTQLRDPLGKGDIIDVPSIGSLTVYSDGSSSQSAQSVTNSATTLTADQHPWIPVLLPAVAQEQIMDGMWAAGVARQAGLMLKNNMDETFLRTYLAKSLCYDTAGTYHDNVAAAALTPSMIANCKAALLANDGTMPQDLALFVHPYGEADITTISGFVPNSLQSVADGNLGIPHLGNIMGVPVYQTNSVLRNMTVAGSASNIASNVVTITVPAGHGFVAGQKIYTTGFTVNIPIGTPVAITSVTATTVVVALTGSNGSNGTGNVIAPGAQNIMMNTAQMFVAQQRAPFGRVVPDLTTTGDVLQLSSIWGYIGRAAHARVLHSVS